MAGFSLAAVAAGCSRSPVSEAIPFVTAPEEIVPGRAYWMASTCHGCPARCGVLVKCRDGRPIRIEGNPEHPLSRGGLCAVGQASVLELYDTLRLDGPMLRGAKSDWASVDAFVREQLAGAQRVRVLSTTLASPTSKRVIDEFLARFPDGKHVVYDVPSASAIREAHGGVLPHYRFDNADVIVSLDADFLGTWISPVEFTKQWSSRRAWHAQFEARLSLTGSKADQRVRLHPRETTAVLAYLAGATNEPPLKPVVLERIRKRLEEARGRSLVVCGSKRVEDQLLVKRINERNYGTTLDLAAPSYQREGNDHELAQLFAEPVDALFVVDANPVYDLPEFAVDHVPLVVTFPSHIDETSKRAHAVCPSPHFLESWNDSEPVAGVYAVTQPAIAPLRNTREVIESLAAWSGKPARAYDMIRATGKTAEWDKTLHDGFAVWSAATPVAALYAAAEPRRAAALPPPLKAATGVAALHTFTPVLYASIAMRDGRHAHNAWLHELPDPITKVTWDNYASLSPKAAEKLNVKDGDVVNVQGVELPAFVQPGQHDGVVAIAIGYGRLGTDRFAKVGPKWLLRRTHLTGGDTVGRRAIQLAKYDTVTITKTGKRHELATTQLYNRVDEHRPEPFAPVPSPRERGEGQGEGSSLWPAKAKGAHQWAMAIDLAKCTGCSACVIGCQSENNVPVVGKDEVLREREMHWIRIDRYFKGEGDELQVVHQPMMCAHCGNAPCETVCPVLATVHSSDGLNQQVYNRCVGTRYCANNCPYKVRRFNWFDYPHDDVFANLTLNPDVAVRSRGVMEKCSMCVQRIEEARIVAKQQGLPIADGAIRTACEQSCPADAIRFGDANDPKSRIAALRKDERYFVVLEELNVKPAVGYLTV
ncbi:MAG TPA: 4Fe-4S dicluster domain-containing protein [Thermoanaerobaculia bacterium]|nr:4Fe-4S dicluster domain-containing protein [Thermoanaerobaculia bacterium]